MDRCAAKTPERFQPTTAPDCGQALGPYRLLEQLGSGGSGTVWKAEHRQRGHLVALKVLDPDLVEMPGVLDRFQAEIEAVTLLSHPHIVSIYESGEADGLHYLALEYVPGPDLARLLAEGGPLPLDQACTFVRQAALALEHIHQAGLVHRDVKPANLMVDSAQPGPAIKLLDLGLARFNPFVEDDAAILTRQGELLGTPDYIAPEQAIDAHRVDGRADIYSLGCTFYHLLAGQPPFPEGSITKKLIAHQLHDPLPIEELRSHLPQGLSAVVRRMMARRPEDRYQTAAEVAEALVPETRTVAPVPPRAAKRPARRMACRFAACFGAIGLMTLALAAPLANTRQPLVAAPAVEYRTVPPASEPMPRSDGWEHLLVGTSGDGWDAEPPSAFEFMTVDGLPAVRIAGHVQGTLTSRREFEDFHLRAEFKLQESRGDVGCFLYHGGEHPLPDANGRLAGLGFRLGPGLCGGLSLTRDANLSVETLGRFSTLQRPEGTVPPIQYDPAGRLFAVPLLVPPLIVPRAGPEKPAGAWNTLEIITAGDRSEHRINGQSVLVVTAARRWAGLNANPLHKGKIQLQSGSGEVYYRNLVLRKEAP